MFFHHFAAVTVKVDRGAAPAWAGHRKLLNPTVSALLNDKVFGNALLLRVSKLVGGESAHQAGVTLRFGLMQYIAVSYAGEEATRFDNVHLVMWTAYIMKVFLLGVLGHAFVVLFSPASICMPTALMTGGAAYAPYAGWACGRRSERGA
ncbi:hypothetical protein Vretifemale_5055 [Volvox reticuliferus]|uniref:Uncharacterized protein n=1 Tax=Volvox reticuliferus TaxID=1737510 RepID=A0A8J4FJY7_9CHLO|nr:hypothetical protein Vretifemale_5055 [Volvox reticuliferus]